MDLSQLLFSETHEWVRLENDGGDQIATVGLTAHALEQLGDLTFLEAAQEGAEVVAGQSFGEIESVKAASDMYSPVDGVVVSVNRELSSDLQVLTDDPYGAGWIVKIRVTNPAGLSKLMDYETYHRQLAEHEG